ncbi:hypothetical protein [Flavobacterium sp. LC2016-12]|uniref:hypothetical protein n=1 Tax=Flavobacterium sp. LC2016-12 TaxID=2783794 RepID=UPI00188ACD88|nr:hypothetical protein [Flavobacterium sp. LC2016-12]MBF4466212.1 hypothetical protein [Flavobacterium sp. LC2016-12]
MKSNLFIIIIVLVCISCKNKPVQTGDNYEKILVERENKAAETPITVAGDLQKTITFEVKANAKDFAGGIQPWASVEKPKKDLPGLINKTETVISEHFITIIIDYPLLNRYQFDLKSENGFSREMLLTEISKHYFKLYAEEEKTATIKTIPMEKRTMYNRNETNGKYGIWGHDIADLVLTEIQVYKTKKGNTIITLGIDS